MPRACRGAEQQACFLCVCDACPYPDLPMPPQRYHVWHPANCDTFPWFVADSHSREGRKTIARFQDENLAQKVARRLNVEAATVGDGSIPQEVTRLLGDAAASIGAARRMITKNYLPARIGSLAHPTTLSGLESVLKILARVMREDLKAAVVRPPKSTVDEDDDEESGDDYERT